MKAKWTGILSALLASICCVGPLLLISVGLGAGAAVISRYHWLFIAAAIVVLALTWTKYFREKTRCACEHKTMQGRRSGMVTLLIATVIVLGFGSLNISRYVFASVPASVETRTQLANGLVSVVIPVEGMTCATCEIAVRHAIKRIDGVKSARVSVASNTATVEYDSAKTNPEQLVAAINSTGYHASLPNKINDMAKNKNTDHAKTDSASTTFSQKAAAVTADRISVFKVPLQCPAAPQIGCGSASKPILLDLEKQPGVLQAWLNRAGTIISVVWRSDSSAEDRRNVVADLEEDKAVEMQGTPHDETVRDFLSGKGWYRGAEVDRLSEEEAGIIAVRFVRRVQAKTMLTKDKAEGLQAALTNALRKKLTGECCGPNQKEASVEQVAGKYLDPAQIKILKEAIDKGVRPLPNES